MNPITKRTGSFFVVALVAAPMLFMATSVWAGTPKVYEPPEPTAWKPVGCKIVPSWNPILPARDAWHNAHADVTQSDEVDIALAPVFTPGWVAEPSVYHPASLVFDDEGNIYGSPYMPYEDIILYSIDARDGSRRWSVPNTTGAPPGAHAPLVLDNPCHPGEKVFYMAVYDRAVAVRTDGTTVWDVPTGLTQLDDPFKMMVMGVNYLPQADAIAGITYDGHVFVLDRKTGAQLLREPHALPGEPSPRMNPLEGIPQAAIDRASAIFETFVELPAGRDMTDVVSVLLGNEAEVANNFAVDPHTGHIWIAATAPDAEDGTVDGVSEYGALYGFELVRDGKEHYQLLERCHTYFEGGSASTPSLSLDGKRVYFGDNFGLLIAINIDGTLAWEVDTGAQIFGSVGVSSDNGEIYAASQTGVFKVVDEGDHGSIAWGVNFDCYENLLPGEKNMNLNLVSIGANAINVQVACGFFMGTVALPLRSGIAQVDRETGQIRYFQDALEESVASMSTGPDGAIYMAHSPLRRLLAYVFGEMGMLPPSEAPIGGIRKWTPERLDLLARDAVLAAADRAENAYAYRKDCPESARYNVKQIRTLISQALEAGDQAVNEGDFTAEQWASIERELKKAKLFPTVFTLPYVERKLRTALELFPE